MVVEIVLTPAEVLEILHEDLCGRGVLPDKTPLSCGKIEFEDEDKIFPVKAVRVQFERGNHV